ncbi:MAG: hypothetical protein AB1656_02675 [Candidatus Omnitrophota bacterium]
MNDEKRSIRDGGNFILETKPLFKQRIQERKILAQKDQIDNWERNRRELRLSIMDEGIEKRYIRG